MAMARALSQSQKQYLCRFFSRQSRISKTQAEKPKKQRTGVPSVGARCKSILGLNWRGQLNTLKPRLADKEEREKADKTLTEISNYIVCENKLIIHIPQESQHCPNLLLDNRASLIIGHTDPSPLMQVFKQVKRSPPHTLLVGTLLVPDDNDDLSSESMETIIRKELSELKQVVIQSSSSMRVLLESGSHVLRTYVQSLNRMLEAKEDDTFYQFDAKSCHYIDLSGAKHLVEWEMLRKTDKCLSPLLQAMIEGINRNQKRRTGLKVLCAWFLHVKVEEAFALSADRCGLDVLAKVVSDTQQPLGDSHMKTVTDGVKPIASTRISEWKDVRLAFREEMRDATDFLTILSQMERECVVGMPSSKEQKPSSSSEEYQVHHQMERTPSSSEEEDFVEE